MIYLDIMKNIVVTVVQTVVQTREYELTVPDELDLVNEDHQEELWRLISDSDEIVLKDDVVAEGISNIELVGGN